MGTPSECREESRSPAPGTSLSDFMIYYTISENKKEKALIETSLLGFNGRSKAKSANV